MNSISAALHDLRTALQGLVSDHHHLRQQLESFAHRGTFQQRPSGRRASASGGPAKRGRAFKFTDAQAVEFRAQVEGGKSAPALAKELKISLPTMYNTLRRAGWTGRRGRPAGGTARAAGGRPPGGQKKRGRAFKFTDAQAADLRKQVDGGKSALALARELKISLPTMYSTLKRAGWSRRPAGRTARASSGRTQGGAKKRGRAFKFSDDQAAGFRKRVEAGEKVTALAKELKISLPTMYSTLKRAGWKGRKG